LIPADIFTIPEMATVGLMEQQVTEKQFGAAMVGKVDFGRLARAYIMAASSGVLKLVADPTGHKLLGIQIAGNGATDPVHLGQMALLNDMSVDTFDTTIVNFPTMAEGYRLAALDTIYRRDADTALIHVERDVSLQPEVTAHPWRNALW
jgi:NAD(P) transhydrogenase